MDECREKARELLGQEKPRSWVGAAIIVLVWLALAALGIVLVIHLSQIIIR